MSWNEPDDKKDDQKKSSSEGPPDLEQMLKSLFGKAKQTSSAAGEGGVHPGSGKFISLIFIVIFFLWAISGIFIVAPAEEAVVLRFGQYKETLGPGPHWIPSLIDTRFIVNTKKIDSFEVKSDYLTKSSDNMDKEQNQVIDVSLVQSKSQSERGPSDVDKNVVYVEMSVQYRIGDPRQFLFNIVDARNVLENAARSALSQAIGEMKLDEVLTRGREQLGVEVTKRLSHLMETYGSGITVRVVNVRKAQAPEEVAGAFLEVAQAGQDEQRFVQQAEAYASRVVPLAEGVALRMNADAQAYKQSVVLNAKAAIAKYHAILSVYEKSPQITRDRLYLDAMQYVLEHSPKILVDMKDSNSMLYLPIDQLMKNHTKETAQTQETEQLAAIEPPITAPSDASPPVNGVASAYRVDRFNSSREGA